MEQKDVSNSNNLNQQQGQHLKYLSFFQQQRKPEYILQHLLKNYVQQEIDARNKLARVKNTLQDQLDSFSLAERMHFKKYLISDQLKNFLQHFCGEVISEDKSVSLSQKLSTMEETYIEKLSTKIEQLLIRVKSWREEKARLLKRKSQESRANLLLYKHYNIKNYLQQLLLVKDLVARVNKIFRESVPDMRHLEELVGKRGVPYTFYKRYCLNNCCRAISLRAQNQALTMLIQSAANLQLLQHMKQYFFQHKSLDQKCSKLLLLAKYIRITNPSSLSIQDGFVLTFKPYFLESLQENCNINSTEYLKSRSIMQSSEEAIDIWHEFEQIKLETYCLWYYEQMHVFKRKQLLHIQTLKNILQQYKWKYSWIREIELKNNKIHGRNSFSQHFIKSALITILKPLLVHLYFQKIAADKVKKVQKLKTEYNQYWLYWLFHSYPLLYNFLNEKVRELILHFSKIQKFASFEEGELTPNQYYMYYKQFSQVIDLYLQNNKLAEQFRHFWKDIIVKVSGSIISQKNKIETQLQFQIQLQFQSMLENEEKLLIQLLKNRKQMDSEIFVQNLLVKVTKLNFNTSNYFLLQDAIKCLPKQHQKQIEFIRQVAYKQFYQ